MKKQEDYSIQIEGGEPDFYSKYTFSNEIKRIDFTLVSNKGKKSFLIKEHPYFDYFLIVEGYTPQEIKKQIITQVQNIPEVLMGMEIDPNQLASKVNLMFD